MARCYICNKSIDEVHLDHRDMKPRPCSECENVIAEIVQQYSDERDDMVFSFIESDVIEFNEEIHSGQPDLVHS